MIGININILQYKGLTGESMKRFYVLIFLFLIMGGVFYANAQDLIILKNGYTIEAKVLEISPTEIKYKRFDHLDGPTIVIMAMDVLSIKYENGRTEIINSVSQSATTTPSTSTVIQEANQPNLNPRLNIIGATLGYQGVSAFGFSLNGTVSPTNYTFFDFNLGLGFNSFAFNGRINFNAFVPLKIGGWYTGIGIGGGYNELFGGVIAGNITTGFILFNWLNIAYTLQLGNFDGIINHNIITGYSYRFKSQEKPASSTAVQNTGNNTRNVNIEISDSFVVERIIGNVQYQEKIGETWNEVKIGDVFTKEIRIRTPLYTSLVLSDGNRIFTIHGGRVGRIDSLLRLR
jgi:hypothetical protein